MSIPLAPVVPNPNSSTFAEDAYPFTQWMASLPPAINEEAVRLNSLGFGSYNATSASSLVIGIGSKSLTTDTNKGFTAGQPLMLAQTSNPTNYMVGQVTSYNSGTGALVLNVTNTQGSGTITDWTISVASVVLSGVSPDSIVVLTSGTSWTCPTGVTKVRGYVEGGSGGGGSVSSGTGASGGGGGGVMFVANVTPGQTYTYAIGAGGVGRDLANQAGGTGGSTTITISGVVYTGGGGGAGGGGAAAGGSGGSGSGTGAMTVFGMSGEAAPSYGAQGGRSAFGAGYGGASYGVSSSAGSAGRITLELYK